MSRWSPARAIRATLALLAVVATAACDEARSISIPVQNVLTPSTAVGGRNRVYIADRTRVLIYKYAQDYFIGKLTGMQYARGMCTDPAGDVYVTNFESADVLEFAVGQSDARQINDVSPYPVDCSIDPAHGSLAVANQNGETEYSAGNVAIYKHAKGSPKTYRYSGFSSFASCAFDSNGDLLVAGLNTARRPAFAYLAFGAKSLRPITLQSSSETSEPSYVRWDGRYFVVDFISDDNLVFTQYAITKGAAVKKESIPERVLSYGVAAFWVGRIGKPSKRHAANAITAVTADGVYFWKYPSGTLVDHQYYNSDATGITATGE